MKICVIPARGGSKRIPSKNIKQFAGKKMICYAIEAARKSKIFDAIYVSTESDEIASIALDLGVSLIKRPKEFADDHTPTNKVMAHAIHHLADRTTHVELVACIYPCVPFIRLEDLQQAWKLMQGTQNAEYIFPITEFPSHVQRALKRNASGKVEPLFPQNVFKRSQDVDGIYYDVGQFYFGTVEAWLSGKSPHECGIGMIIPHWRVVDIDTPDDWVRAELIYQALVNKGEL